MDYSMDNAARWWDASDDAGFECQDTDEEN